jgi:transposase
VLLSPDEGKYYLWNITINYLIFKMKRREKLTAGKQRRKYTASFKSEVALEALDERASLSALGKRYGISPGLIGRWRKSVIENSHLLFEDSYPGKDVRDRRMEALNREIDVLTADCEFLKDSLSGYLKSKIQ